jgi:hypothetical protein
MAPVSAVMEFVVTLAIACGIVYLLARRNRERNGNAPLRHEIEGDVSFRAPLHCASVLGTGGFGGTRGMWIRLRGPKRLTVGANGFVVSAPLAGVSLCSAEATRPLRSAGRRPGLSAETG